MGEIPGIRGEGTATSGAVAPADSPVHNAIAQALETQFDDAPQFTYVAESSAAFFF